MIQLLPSIINSLFTAVAMGAIITSAGPVLLLVTLAFVILQTLIQLTFAKKSAVLSVQLTDWSRRMTMSTAAIK